MGAPVPAEYAESEVHLPRGSTLALFTDGLVEVPGGSLTDGLNRVADIVAAMGEHAPEALCNDLLEEVSLRSLRDDVALLVVRLSSSATPAAASTPPQGTTHGAT
jgi:serine phosphatase RsbU (regulator of sigma subunit)